MTIDWDNDDVKGYYVGKISGGIFRIDRGVGNFYGATIEFAGDCYGILNSAMTVEEAKNFCEFIARAYGLDVEQHRED